MDIEIKKSGYLSAPAQTKRLIECRAADVLVKQCCGEPVLVFPGVYGTSIDTELMIDTVDVRSDETFLEVGVGTGAVSIALAKRAKSGAGVDINERAIENSNVNAKRANVSNVTFIRSDLFDSVDGQFDVVVCNPPYGNQPVKDEIDRMFWDPKDEMKQRFFEEVHKYLKPDGRIYFGWANFADIDVKLPIRLADENGFQIMNTVSRDSRNKEFQFIVFEIERK